MGEVVATGAGSITVFGFSQLTIKEALIKSNPMLAKIDWFFMDYVTLIDIGRERILRTANHLILASLLEILRELLVKSAPSEYALLIRYN